MEAPPEEQHDSFKTSEAEVTDTTTTPSSSVISPKKPIQLGIVQSSTGARVPPGTLSLMKKSRWDQAPGPGENEEESKEANIQPKTPEESNIKSLIKKFEDISGSSKLEKDKPDEGSSSKPGRVKLVRTNFTKPENPIVKPIDSGKVDVGIGKIEEADLKTINTISEIPTTEVISVLSSKALQIISSNYDSPTDESSQEADNVISSPVQEKKPSDSAYASLEIPPDGNNKEEKEDTIAERLSSSLSLKDESVPKSGDNEIENENIYGLTSTTEVLIQKDIVEGIAKKTITISTVDSEIIAKDSQIIGEGVDLSEGASQEIISEEVNNKINLDQHEKEKIENVSDEPSGSAQHITQSPDLFNENIPSGKKQTQEDSLNIMSKQGPGTENSADESLVSEITVNVESSISEINSVQAKLEAIESAGGYESNLSENKTDIDEPVENIDSKDGKTKSSLTNVEVCNEVNLIVVKEPSDEILTSETKSLCEEDFVIVTHADLEDYKVDSESASATECTRENEGVDSSKIETLNADSNFKENLSVDLKASDSEDGENIETVQEVEQIEGMVNKPAGGIQIPEQPSTELIETLHSEAEAGKVQVLENKKLEEEIISEKEHACEKPLSDEGTSHVYSDGVDAKMELIFSENLGNEIEETCPSKQNIEERLTPVAVELVEENTVSEDSVSTDKSSKPEKPENIFETNDSLLNILQSEGSPEAVACHKDKICSGVEMEVKPNVDVFKNFNVEETVPTDTNVSLNDNLHSRNQEHFSDQNNLVTEEHNLIEGENRALTEQVALDSVNIEDVVTGKTCVEEKSEVQVEVTTKLSTENVENEEATSDSVKSECGMELKNKDLDINPHISYIDKNIEHSVVINVERQNPNTDILDTVGNHSSGSKSPSENNVKSVQGSNFESNASEVAYIDEDRQALFRDKLGDFKAAEESEIITEEVEDFKPSDDISEGSPQILKEEVFQKCDVTFGGKDSTDPQVSIEVPEISKDLGVEKLSSFDNAADSKITQVTDNFDIHDSDMQMPKGKDITKPSESDAINESDEPLNEENVSNLMSIESIKTDIGDFPESSIPIAKVVNELKNTNQEDTTLAEKGEFNSHNKVVTQKCDPKKGSHTVITQPENILDLDSNSIKNFIVDSPGSSYHKEMLNESKEVPCVGDAPVSDSNSNPVDTKQTLDKAEGSIEVSQQETIERSIDMLFEVPSSEQPPKPIAVSSSSSSKDTILEVSSETKQLFTEEIQKEMMKLSPEHEAQCEVETINLPDSNRLSTSLKISENKASITITSEDNVVISDSCELSEESTLDNEDKMAELSVELEREKEILMPSDESDIATIQAIDSFLEGDNMEVNQNLTEPKSKSDDLPIETVDEGDTKITKIEEKEEANNFECPASINEKTNAEDVMLGVEGDLDLDNSLSYDTKKLDLSPSSEPSISEETYDLPGDSYDKESLEKDQESTNLLSDVLDDVEAGNKESDSELLTQISKKNDTEKQSLLETTTVSEVDLKDQDCEENVDQKDSGTEGNILVNKDIDLNISKTQLETKVDLSKDKAIKTPSMAGESKNGKSLLQTSVDSKIKRPKSNLSEEEASEFCGRQTSKTKHEQEVKEIPRGTMEKCDEKHESAEIEVSQATSSEPTPQTLGCKDVDVDFENLIPSSTVSSKEKAELESNSTKVISCNIEGENHENLENDSKELGSKKEQNALQKCNQREVIRNVNTFVSNDSVIEQDKMSEEFKFIRTENISSIIKEKEDDKVSSDDTPSIDIGESNNKTSKRQCSTIEEIELANVDQDKMTSDINKGPNRFKKTYKSMEEIEPSEEHANLETESSIKEKSTTSPAPCQTTIESCPSKEKADKITNEDAKSIPLATSTNEARASINVEFKSSQEDNPDDSFSSKGGKSISPKDPLIEIPSESQPSNEEQKITLDTSLNQTGLPIELVKPESLKEDTFTKTDVNVDAKSISNVVAENKSVSSSDLTNQVLTEAIPPVSEQAVKPSKPATYKEVPPPVRVSARQKQRQAAALAAKEKAEAAKSPGQGAVGKKGSVQEKQVDKRGKKSLSPTKELHIKITGKPTESGKQSPLTSQKSPKNLESKVNLQVSPKKMAREVSQDKLEPITLKLSKEENPVIVRSSSLSPKKNVAPHSPQGKTLSYTLKIGKDSTTIIPKDSTPSPTRRESSPGSGSAKADLSGKVGYLIKDTGLTITPVASAETQEQKLNKITLKLSKAGGHPEIKQENKSETWKAIRKLGEIDIVPVEGKSPNETPKRKENSEERSPEKKIKLGDVTVEPSTSSGVSKLQGLLTQAPLNQSDSSEDGKFIGFGSPTEKISPGQQQHQASYDIGMIRHDDSPQPPRKRGRPRKITSPDDIVHSVSVPHSLPTGLTAKDILAASLQHQSLQQHLHPSYQPPQRYQPPEDLDSSQPMVPLFDLFEETFMEPTTPPTIFPDQVQPSTEIIMRSARGRPIGRSRRPRGSGLLRGHERGGPRGRPRGSRGMKRILEEMEAMSFPDPDQPITLENIDAEMGPRVPEHAASELTMALLRKSIEGKKEILEKKARRSDGSEEGNSDLDAMVREMKEKIEAAYLADRKSPVKEGKKRTPEKLELTKKSPPGLIPIHQKQDERRKSAEGKEAVKRKLSVDKSEESQQQVPKRKSTEEKPESSKSEEGSIEESAKDDSQMEVDQPATPTEEPSEQEEIKTEPEPPPKPVKPRPKSKAEIKRIKREKDRLRREAKKLAALEALKAPPPNPCEEDTRMSASDPNEDGEGSGIKKNRMEVGDPEGKEFTVEQIAEYQWPLQGGELYMIQEQISTWLGVKSFQRKYPDLKRRRVEMEERTYLCDSGLVAETMCDLGLTAVSSSELLDIMFQDFPDQYEELRKHMREKQARELINKQKERKKFEQTLSKSDLKEHAIQSLVSWNSNLNKGRTENRKCHLDLQTWTIQYPRSKAAKMTRPSGKLGSYPVALIPGQYADYYKRYTPQELRYFPVNTVLYGPLQPNEMHSTGGSDGSQSESEDSSSSDGTSDSSSEGEGEGTEEDEKERERECKTCGSKKANEAMLQCSQCSHNIHVTCADLNPSMLTHVRKYEWQCSVCKTCQRCDNAKNESKMLFCDLCDRGYHSYCVGLRRVPAGSWTCELCTTGSGTS